MNIAFAGLRHCHIFDLYKMVQVDPNCQILGAFEADSEARHQAKTLGVICNYPSYDALLADPQVEVVALGGCYADRGDMAIRALQAGKHVMADKPLCTDLAELDMIEKLAHEKNLKVSCMLTMRFEKKIQALKKLIGSEVLGEINNVYFGGQHPLQYGRRPAWYYEPGKHGGVINDIAIHGIDVLNFAVGLEVDKTHAARCWNKFADCEPDFRDSAQLMLSAKNGAGILADVSYSIPDGVEFSLPYYWQFYIWGTKGTIAFSLNEKNSFYFLKDCEAPILLEEQPVEIDYLTDFRNLVAGREDVVLSMEECIRATRITQQIQKRAMND